MAVPVLMYHALESAHQPSVYKEPGDRVYAVSVQAFASQMQYLRDNGFTPLLLHEVASSTAARKIVITFDDGHASDVALALPILQDFGFRAEFYVTSDWLGTPGFIDRDGVARLLAAGMVVGSHGKTHRFFDDMSLDEARHELQSSCERLQQSADFTIDRFSAPGGRQHRQQQALNSEQGIAYSLSSRVSLWDGSQSQAIPRIAIMHDTSPELFARICEGERQFYARARWRYNVLLAAKRLLGNAAYQRVREKFF